MKKQRRYFPWQKSINKELKTICQGRFRVSVLFVSLLGYPHRIGVGSFWLHSLTSVQLLFGACKSMFSQSYPFFITSWPFLHGFQSPVGSSYILNYFPHSDTSTEEGDKQSRKYAYPQKIKKFGKAKETISSPYLTLSC